MRFRDQVVRELFRRGRELAERVGFDLGSEDAAPNKRRSGYKGARKSRLNEDWITGGASGNAELSRGMRNLRERSRDLVRNNRYGKHGASQLASYMSGVRPMSDIKADAGASDIEKERVAALNREVDSVFKAWSKVCHANGKLRFDGLQTHAALGMVVSGETFTRLRVRRLTDGLPVPLQLEVLEADLVDHTRNETLPNGGWIIQGIEFSPIGAVEAYHMHRTHPGEAILGVEFGAFDTVRVPAPVIAHLYPEILSRPGQVRGEPWYHATIDGFRDFDGYQDAERVRLRGSASLMGVVEASEEITFADEDDEMPVGINPLRDANGDIVERIRPGTIAYAQQGQTIKFNAPPVIEGFKSYASVELHGLAAGILMPYELLAGDLSDTNFSSIMFGMGSFWRLMGRFQKDGIIPQWGDPVWERFVELGKVVRVLPPEAGPVKWVTEPWPLVDPVKQNRGKLIAVRAGAGTLEDWIAETGKDPDTVLASHLALQKWAEENNVVLDGIASTTTLAGQLQDPIDENEDGGVDGGAQGE